MSRVRVEIFEDDESFNDAQSVEVSNPDVREAFNRAVRMARSALPEEKKGKGPLSDAGSYTLEMKNVQFTEVNRDLLFGGHAEVNPGFNVKVVSDEPLRKPCEGPCPDENCRERCARPVGHEGQHSSADNKCAWDRRTEPEEQCTNYCDKADPECYNRCTRQADHDGECSCLPAHAQGCSAACGTSDCWADCQRPKDHRGDHRCNRPQDHERCLNEIGAPSATPYCQKTINHDGDCDGGQA